MCVSGIAGEGKQANQSLSHREHAGTRSWQSREARASLLDPHFRVPTVKYDRLWVCFPPPTWHRESSQASEPRHGVPALADKL